MEEQLITNGAICTILILIQFWINSHTFPVLGAIERQIINILTESMYISSRQPSISFPSWNQSAQIYINYTVWCPVIHGTRRNDLHACMSILIRKRLISLHFLLHNQQWDVYLSLHVERPDKHIAPSCATLKINQKWSPMTSFKSTNVISEKTPWFSV